MRVDEVQAILDRTWSEDIPDTLDETLADVDIIVVADESDPLVRGRVPDKFFGVYEGTVVDPEDDPEGELGPVPPPAGTVYLNARMMTSEDDVRSTLFHEIGHALGLGESEVENLGLGVEDADRP